MNFKYICLTFILVLCAGEITSNDNNQLVDMHPKDDVLLQLCFAVIRMLQSLLGISMESELAFTRKYWAIVGHPYTTGRNSFHMSSIASLHNSLSSFKLANSEFFNFSKFNLDQLLLPNSTEFDFVNSSSIELPSFKYEYARRSVDSDLPVNQTEPIEIELVGLSNDTSSADTDLSSDELAWPSSQSNDTTTNPFIHVTTSSENINKTIIVSTPLPPLEDNQTTTTVITTMKPNSIEWLKAAHFNHTKMVAEKHRLHKLKLEQHLQRLKEHNQQAQLKKLQHAQAKQKQKLSCSTNRTDSTSPSNCSITNHSGFATRLYGALDRILTDWVIIPGEVVEQVSTRLFYNLIDDVRLLFVMLKTLFGVTQSTCRYKLVCLMSHFVAMHVPSFVRNNIPTSGEELYVNLIEAASQSELLNALLTGVMRFDCSDIYRHRQCT